MNAWLQTDDDHRVDFAGGCTIGRLPENTLVLDDPGVSRRHALIHAHGPSGYWLVDFGSRNGVTLNGRRIKEPTRVTNADKIEIAGHRLVFHERKQKGEAGRGMNSAAWKTTQSLEEMFVPVGHGMIILTPDGKVQSISGHAEKWLQVYFAKPARAHALLPAELESWLAQQRKPMKGKARPLAPLRDNFSVEKDCKRLYIRVAEESPDQLLLLLTEQETVFSPRLLARLGLTVRESEVLHWLAEGKSNPEIAVILDASPRTVGKHVEHIYAKLGVESRTAAMLHVMEVLGKI